MDYSALLGPDRYDLAVQLGTQYHLDAGQVLFGYLQVVSQVTGDQQPDVAAADLHDSRTLQVINEQFEHFLKQRH